MSFPPELVIKFHKYTSIKELTDIASGNSNLNQAKTTRPRYIKNLDLENLSDKIELLPTPTKEGSGMFNVPSPRRELNDKRGSSPLSQ